MIDSHWNVPAKDQIKIPIPLEVWKHGWRLSITNVGQLIVGILWRDINIPLCAQIELTLNYYSGVFHIMHIIPIQVQHITIEADPSLTMIMINPSTSDWNVRFHARQIHPVITRFDQA